MEKKEDTRTSKQNTTTEGVFSILLGTAVSLVFLLLLVLLAAALVWGGVVSETMTGPLLTAAAGLSSFAAGRLAIQKGSGGPPMAVGAGTGLLLCIIFLSICWGNTGAAGFHSLFVSTLLITMAGGCLAGFLGRKGKRKKKKR